MKKPFTAPTAATIVSARSATPTWEKTESPMVEATTTFVSDTTAPALRSNPPVSTTSACPMAASASDAPLPTMLLKSK